MKQLDLQTLKKFLRKANMPHATGNSKVTKEPDGSRTITFEDGDWGMHDNFFGGEPYGGRMVIFYQNKPVWMMVYYGQITAGDFKPDEVYGFLREALQHPPEHTPYRGPDSYKKDNLEYRNELEGDADNYAGKEEILKNGEPLYWAVYHGGLIDQRAQGEM